MDFIKFVDMTGQCVIQHAYMLAVGKWPSFEPRSLQVRIVLESGGVKPVYCCMGQTLRAEGTSADLQHVPLRTWKIVDGCRAPMLPLWEPGSWLLPSEKASQPVDLCRQGAS